MAHEPREFTSQGEHDISLAARERAELEARRQHQQQEDNPLTLRTSEIKFEEVDVQVGNEILTLRVPAGTPDDVIKQKAQELGAGAVAGPTTPQVTSTELPPPPTRKQKVREFVKELPAPLRIAAEVGPSIAGTIVGGVIGATPVGKFVGGPFVAGAAGGLAGETIAQATGLAPESTFAKVATTVAPAVGPIIAKGGKVVAGRFLKLPGVREALNITKLEAASQVLLDKGSEILAKAKGWSAATLFARVRAHNVGVNPDDLVHTLSVLKKLRNEVKPFRSHPEARKVLQTIKLVRKDLGVRVQTKAEIAAGKTVPAVKLADLLMTKRLIDQDIRAFEKSATALDVGVKLRASQRLSYAITRDLEVIARTSPQGGQVFATATAAVARARLEFGIDSLDQTVRRHLKELTVGGRVTENIVDVKSLRIALQNMKDKASAMYDRDFAFALRHELPKIDKFLREHEQFTVTIGQGGGLVLKGAAARATRIALGAITGGLIGAGTGVGTGVGVLTGGIIGSQATETLTGAMLTGVGRGMLARAIRASNGRVPIQTLETISQTSLGALRAGPFVSTESQVRETLADPGRLEAIKALSGE